MRLLKVMLATALVLDAALVMATTTTNIAGDPMQTIGFATESNGNVFSQLLAQR